jgi:adenine-specific DNA-methyltransferase
MATAPTETRKKRRGVFYTPDSITKTLCKWAVRNKDDVVLEPSFGGCGFIQSLSDRFRELGRGSSLKPIFGCDVDARAFRHLNRITTTATEKGNFIKRDFLKVKPADFGDVGFTAVVGNPPYVSYHNMFAEQRRTVERFEPVVALEVRKTASLWAYFVAHSLRFLTQGGRVAWVLPGSLLQSEYGKAFLHSLSPYFARVVVISLSQRFFLSHGTEESTEILLCENYGCGPASNGIEIKPAANLTQYNHLITSWQTRSWSGNALNGRVAYTLLQSKYLDAYREIGVRPEIKRLGEIAAVLIGIVTGNNKFFVLNRSAAKKHGLTLRHLRPILSKFRFAQGMYLKKRDLKLAHAKDEACLLVNRHNLNHCAAQVRRYLLLYPESEKSANATFKKRSVWHCSDDGKVPDAFFPYMNHIGPRIVLNECATTSTNTIHRLYFRTRSRREMELAAISLLTTFSQLSAEIEGRTYGAGVLKHEPGEAARIRLFMPQGLSDEEIRTTAKRINSLLKAKAYQLAQHEADNFIFGEAYIDQNKELFAELRRGLTAARNRRY